MTELTLSEMEIKVTKAKEVLAFIQKEYLEDGIYSEEEVNSIRMVGLQIVELESKIDKKKKERAEMNMIEKAAFNVGIGVAEHVTINDSVDKKIEFLYKVKKKIESLDAAIKSVQGLSKSINALSDVAFSNKETDKANKYLEMGKHLNDTIGTITKLKKSMDEIANIEDSLLTKNLEALSGKIDKFYHLLDWFSYLQDNEASEKFINNPESFKAAEAWGEHMIEGFGKIATLIDKIPVPAGPLKDILTVFKGTATSAQGLIKQFMNATKRKLQQIETESGGHISLMGDHKHYVNEKNGFKGAFVNLYMAVYNKGNKYQNILKACMEEHRKTLSDYSETAETRIEFLNTVIVKKYTKGEITKEEFDLIINLIKEHKYDIMELAINEV